MNTQNIVYVTIAIYIYDYVAEAFKNNSSAVLVPLRCRFGAVLVRLMERPRFWFRNTCQPTSLSVCGFGSAIQHRHGAFVLTGMLIWPYKLPRSSRGLGRSTPYVIDQVETSLRRAPRPARRGDNKRNRTKKYKTNKHIKYTCI